MHIPDKHRVEGVEEAIKEAEEHPHAPEPGIKIIINVGAPPHNPGTPKKLSPPKSKLKLKPKPKKKKGNSSSVPGKNESALSGMY
jgi:hypothetical protein